MIFFITISSILLFTFLIYLFFNSDKSASSDHYFHLKLSDEIRENKRKFITHFKHLVIPTPIYYPQLYHLFLSFFSKKFVNEKGYLLNYLFNALQVITIVIGVILFKNNLEFTISKLALILLLFVSTPFFYVFWNAKNMGISGRSFGLFIGYCYFICLLYFLHSNNYYLLILLTIFSAIAWFGSNFAIQSILFISIVLSFFNANLALFILLPVFFGLCLWFLISPKVSKVYFIELFRLKVMFFKHLIYTMSLNSRPSIWGDFILGFKHKFKTASFKDFFIYVYTNSVISALVGFPSIFILTVYTFYNLGNLNSIQFLLFEILISSEIVFIVTTFRKTRFLGEPERYLEYILPISLLLFFSVENKILYISLIANLLFLLINLVIIKTKNKKNSINYTNTLISKFAHSLNSTSGASVNILSNNEIVSRYLMEFDNLKMFLAYISKPETLGIQFDDIYEKHGNEYKPEAFSKFFLYTKFDYIIIKSENINEYLIRLKEIGTVKTEKFELIDEIPNVIIFKTNS